MILLRGIVLGYLMVWMCCALVALLDPPSASQQEARERLLFIALGPLMLVWFLAVHLTDQITTLIQTARGETDDD